MCALLAPVLLTVRALEDCRGIEWADFLNSFPFLKYPGMAYQPLTSCRLIPEYFKKGKSASSIPWQISSALTAKSTVLIMHTTLQIWQIKSEVYEDSIVRDLCVRERYNSANSCSGTCIYRLLKGMVLNIVLKSTHEKQATKICSRKVVMQTTPHCVVDIP